jgi:DNA topoisomerase III
MGARRAGSLKWHRQSREGDTVRLFLCEKPSQGKDIARVLGAHRPRGGCYLGEDLIVTWCIGHLIEAAPPEGYDERYKRWSIETLPIIPDRWRLEVKSGAAGQFKAVKKLLSSATEVVIATDADREGEMIARELLDFCRYRGPILRLWLSALNEASIRQALTALRPGEATLPLYHAALARSRADWLIGMNLSRLFTLLGQRAGMRGVLSVGRVQTPTLQLIVRRDREIAAFVAVPYWTIVATVTANAQTFLARWIAPKEAVDEAGRCVKSALAQAAADRLRRAGLAQVKSVDTQRIVEPAPLPFDLSTLQQECSRRLGLGAQETLDLAEALYERHKATTYPRTDCRYLPESMLAEVPAVCDALLASDPALAPLLNTIDRTQRSRAWNDAKLGAHHGIIPTTEPTAPLRMSERERGVYQLIRAHYLAQFLPSHEHDRTVAQLTCGTDAFESHGKRTRVIGWRSVVEATDVSDEGAADDSPSQALPALRSGMTCAVAGVELKALRTRAPKPYTQGELIQAMKGIARFVSDPRLKQKLKETSGLGTEATRASIIQGLIRRGYLIEKGRALRASEAAFVLLDAVPEAIADPGTTAIWEQALERIAAGDLSLEAFLEKQSTWVRQLVGAYANAPLRVTRSEAPHT